MNSAIQDTVKLGELTLKLTRLFNTNPAAALRAGEAIEREFAGASRQTASSMLADAQTTIARMGEPAQQQASDLAAELTAEWQRVSATMSAAEVEHLKTQVGHEPVALAMRARLIADIRARGGDARTVGALR